MAVDGLPRAVRLRYIEQTTAQLQSRSYSEMRLIFREFGLNPSNPDDTWGGGFEDEADYARLHLSALTDEDLIELQDYVTGPAVKESVTWEPGYVNAFLSHLATEKDYVTSFKDQLERRGFSAFVAHEDITPSAAWRESIEAHLSTCDLAIAFVQPGFFNSQWTEQEIGWVLGVGRPIISLLFDPNTELRGFMAFRQAIKVGQRSVSELADMVTDSAAKSPTLGPKLRRGAVQRLVTSPSYFHTYDAARNLATHWPTLTTDEAVQIERAKQENDQVGHCVKASRDIAWLLKRAERPPPRPDLDEEPF